MSLPRAHPRADPPAAHVALVCWPWLVSAASNRLLMPLVMRAAQPVGERGSMQSLQRPSPHAGMHGMRSAAAHGHHRIIIIITTTDMPAVTATLL